MHDVLTLFMLLLNRPHNSFQKIGIMRYRSKGKRTEQNGKIRLSQSALSYVSHKIRTDFKPFTLNVVHKLYRSRVHRVNPLIRLASNNVLSLIYSFAILLGANKQFIRRERVID